VRVLLDEQLPRQLVPLLIGHDVRTVQQQGWAGLNLSQRTLGVVVLRAVSNALEDLAPLVPAALNAIDVVQPSQVLRVEA